MSINFNTGLPDSLYERHPMSNDTQVLRATLETALARIEDMLSDDDGQAFKEARKFLNATRPLAARPSAPTAVEPDERAGFEAELPNKLRTRNEHGDYVSPSINDRWAGWQARASKGTK